MIALTAFKVENTGFIFENYYDNSHKFGAGYKFNLPSHKYQKNGKWFIMFFVAGLHAGLTVDEIKTIRKMVSFAKKNNLEYEVGECVNLCKEVEA